MLPRPRSSGPFRASLKLANKHSRLRINNQAFPLWLAGVSVGLPQIKGGPILLEFRPQLTAYRGKLLSGVPDRGCAVHAATFLRERRIVLEDVLLKDSGRMQSILIHELFHFVWWGLGHSSRHSYTLLIRQEIDKGARGELGESSAVAKARLRSSDSELSTARWKNYVCESFCDTAAWIYGARRTNPSATLAQTRVNQREAWFAQHLRHNDRGR